MFIFFSLHTAVSALLCVGEQRVLVRLWLYHEEKEEREGTVQ